MFVDVIGDKWEKIYVVILYDSSLEIIVGKHPVMDMEAYGVCRGLSRQEGSLTYI